MYQEQYRLIRLLLVEDNPADVRLLKLGLKEAGARYSLQIASDGDQATELLRRVSASGENRPDLILLDLNLPNRSGHEVLAMIKGDSRLRLIPVVVLTCSDAPCDILAAYGAGANSYLQKPASLEATLDLMRTIEHYWLNLACLPNVA